MSVNLQIGLKVILLPIEFTQNSWVTMNNTLSWNNHINLLVKKLSNACYMIRNANIYMSAPSLKIIYYAFYHSVMNYGIIFWGNSWHSSIILDYKKSN